MGGRVRLCSCFISISIVIWNGTYLHLDSVDASRTLNDTLFVIACPLYMVCVPLVFAKLRRVMLLAGKKPTCGLGRSVEASSEKLVIEWG